MHWKQQIDLCVTCDGSEQVLKIKFLEEVFILKGEARIGALKVAASAISNSQIVPVKLSGSLETSKIGKCRDTQEPKYI